MHPHSSVAHTASALPSSSNVEAGLAVRVRDAHARCRAAARRRPLPAADAIRLVGQPQNAAGVADALAQSVYQTA